MVAEVHELLALIEVATQERGHVLDLMARPVPAMVHAEARVAHVPLIAHDVVVHLGGKAPRDVREALVRILVRIFSRANIARPTVWDCDPRRTSASIPVTV